MNPSNLPLCFFLLCIAGVARMVRRAVSSTDEGKDLAYWLVRLQKTTKTRVGGYVPLFVRIDSLSGAIEVKARGFNGWLPYREAQLMMATSLKSLEDRSGSLELASSSDKVQAFIAETLRHDIIGDTVLFCDAQNARGFWKWLQDPQINPQGIQLLENAPIESTSSWVSWSGLRVVRVRDYSGGEVPQHFSIKEDGVSQPSGLYAWQETLYGEEQATRIFGSITQKPVQFSGLALGMSRFDEDSRAVKLNAWNPRLLEVVAAILQPHDNPAHWAALAHGLRNSAAYYGAETALPLPLHLAMKPRRIRSSSSIEGKLYLLIKIESILCELGQVMVTPVESNFNGVTVLCGTRDSPSGLA